MKAMGLWIAALAFAWLGVALLPVSGTPRDLAGEAALMIAGVLLWKVHSA